MTWGPFASGLDRLEKKARLRCLRLAVKIIAGPRGEDCRFHLLRAEIGQDDETLADACAAFERLSALDRRRILSSYAEVADGSFPEVGPIRVGEAHSAPSGKGQKGVRA